MAMHEWKSDNYKFVGKAFDYAYANRMNKLSPLFSEEKSNSVDYEMTGTEGYGELQRYDGSNLNKVKAKRGFKTVITTDEFVGDEILTRKQARIDKFGSTQRIGKRLGDSAAMTVYLNVLRMFSGAFNPALIGGDGVSWASDKHPIASMYSEGRKYIPDPEAGTYSNLITSALSVSAITQAQSMANRFITPDGLPFACDFDTLIVSPELEAEAKKICGENARLRPMLNPEDDTNAANPVYGLNYIVLGGGNDGFSKKQWAVCDRTLMKELVKVIYGEKPTVLENQLDNPLEQHFTAYVDFGVGWGDSRQIIFSNPG